MARRSLHTRRYNRLSRYCLHLPRADRGVYPLQYPLRAHRGVCSTIGSFKVWRGLVIHTYDTSSQPHCASETRQRYLSRQWSLLYAECPMVELIERWDVPC